MDESQVSPSTILRAAADFGTEQPYSIRLESHGRHLLYVVRPTPYAHGTDVYASQATAEIVSRRTGFWRAFSPFLMVHSVAFTADAEMNAIFLFIMLGAITTLLATGWWAWWQTR